ncbi:Sodium channel protein Nach [Zootermopsis nevadensis]|uniref:Sodium channel protein Nach n=2 Tax=Zootermopsis nevadensis TaxID=136037 RepID=A0A067QUS6_ZOONE|nr:Sodium channel protein Nach [Zootermopsis nevadensis]
MYRSNANMRVIITYATDDVRNLRVDHRKCRFRDESNLAISDIYSVNLCQSQCRAEMAIRLCGCAPFFYVGVERAHYNICDVQGMICLVDHVKKSKSDGDHKTRDKHSCACYPTCESEEYVIEDTTTEESETDTGGTKLSWCVPNYPTVRMKRDILFTLPDMLVAFGGTAAFFLGCSVLSAVEIFYYCTLRLYFYLLEVRRQRTRYIQHDSRTRVPTF